MGTAEEKIFKKLYLEVSRDFAQLIKKVKHLQKEVEASRNKCWWDFKTCPFCSEIKGLQDFNGSCSKCARIDKEKFFSVIIGVSIPEILERVNLGDIPCLEEKLKEAKEEAKEEVDTDVRGHIADILEKMPDLKKEDKEHITSELFS